ncbi:serpin family protein [Nocardia sp. NRRL WC-3656]|uniref:serpin family protein n=1 Tax=Nocardia sp. NRRL WC-3656 TaxID=1463824 RepID=UPI0004C2BB7B|nr:serpin family protein [Nocardia sp. NRRL WC-3656]
MQPSLAPDVAAANNLTGKWCAAAGSGDFVLSGCGIWPLLALLAAAAGEPARGELTAATGLPAASAHDAAITLLRRIEAAESVRAALGVWVRDDIALRDEWIHTLPPGTIAALRGQDGLDEWARRHTDGLIDRFPARIGAATALALATAIVARTAWRQSFHADVLEPSSGPWRGHRGPALARYSTGLGDAAVLTAGTPVSRVVVRGASDLDVHLLLGEQGATAPVVLAAGLGALDGSVETHRPGPGTIAPGLEVRTVTAVSDTLRIQVPPFAVRSTHDLLRDPELFGLTAATTATDNPFPGLSPVALRVTAAAQDVCARFTADGFAAAAVSGVLMEPTGMPPAPADALMIAVNFDRPFGFLGVHRPTGLAMVAGWVATPTP